MRRMISIAAVLATFAVSVAAPAQEPPDPSSAPEANRSSARELGEQGNALFASGDYAGALEKYERANALVPLPTLGVRIARCLVQLGRLVEASERYLAVERGGLPPNPLPVHQRALEDAKTEREALLPRIPALVVTVSPRGADVTIDGAPLPPALIGEKRMIDPGKRVVVGRLGDASRSVDVDVAEGAVVPVHVSLDGAPAPATGPPHAPQGAEGADPTWSIVGWGAVGLGGAATIVGVATGLAAMGQRSDLESSCGPDLACPPAFHADADGYNGLRTISAVTFFAGLGVAGAGATILILDPGGGSEAEVSLGPGRVGVTGSF